LAGAFALSGGRLTAFGRGDWLVMACALFWAAYALITEIAGRAARPLSYTCGMFITVAALCWPLTLWQGAPDWATLRPALPEVLFVGIMSSAVTFGLLAVAMTRIPAPRAIILLSTEAVFAALIAAAVLGERPSLLGWSGACMVLGAVIIVQWPARR
jgi:drug/metabolite transporter (DMT)-like permease